MRARQFLRTEAVGTILLASYARHEQVCLQGVRRRNLKQNNLRYKDSFGRLLDVEYLEMKTGLRGGGYRGRFLRMRKREDIRVQ